MSQEAFELIFSVLVLLLLIASFLQLTLNLGEKSLNHLGSIRSLTDFITELDDIDSIKDIDDNGCIRQLELIRAKYQMIIHVLPLNSDKEWRKAKTILNQKDK